MTLRKARIAGLLGVVLTASSVRAQGPPAVPGVSAIAPAAGSAAVVASPGGVAAVATPAAPKTLWSCLGLSAANLQACKAKLCQSQLGLAMNSMLTGPVGGVTGGFIPPLCPPAPTAAAIAALAAADPAGSAGAKVVAAQIQKDEADAKARVAAVEYLGTVDCSHWTEATAALINALQFDKNECVRFAAARALNSGCCCDTKVIAALRMTVAGESPKNSAPENSPRVKAAAFAALQNCLMRVPEVIPVEVVPPPPRPRDLPPVREPGSLPPAIPAPPGGDDLKPVSAEGHDMHVAGASHQAAGRRVTAYQHLTPRKTYAQTVEEARRTLIEVSRTPQAVPFLPVGKQDVFHALTKAREDVKSAPRANPTPARVARDPAVKSTSYVPSGGQTQARSQSDRGLFGLIFKPRSRPSGE